MPEKMTNKKPSLDTIQLSLQVIISGDMENCRNCDMKTENRIFEGSALPASINSL